MKGEEKKNVKWKKEKEEHGENKSWEIGNEEKVKEKEQHRKK